MKVILLSLVVFLFTFLFANGEPLNMLKNKSGKIVVKAIAIIKGRYDDSKISGIVTFTQTISKRKFSPISIAVNLTGFPNTLDKRHGLHIHWSSIESSSDDPIEFCSKTGPHFNPTNGTHGDFSTSSSRHLGDYGNVESRNGSIVATLEDETNKLVGPNSIIGRSLVLHRDEDDLGKKGDQGSMTSGNSGPRIACGVIGHVFTPDEQKRAIEMNKMIKKIKMGKSKKTNKKVKESKKDKNSNDAYSNDGYSNDGYSNGGYSNDGYSNDGYSNDGYSDVPKSKNKKESVDQLKFARKSTGNLGSRVNTDNIRALLEKMHERKKL